MSRKNALAPLADRLNANQAAKREMKIAARRVVAAQLQGQINVIGQLTTMFQRLGFFRRVWWLLTGKLPWKWNKATSDAVQHGRAQAANAQSA